MILINELEINLDDFHLECVDTFHVNPGEKVLVTGDNGSGKTVFLCAILDLVKHRKGTIFIDGKKNTDGDWQNNTGAYLDRSFLIPYLTPREYIKYIGMVKRVAEEESSGLLGDAIDRLSFDLSEKKLIRDLSVGNQKKLGLIASLVGSPSLLVWDEPFANLDSKAQQGLETLMGELLSLTIVYSEHRDEFECLHDRKILIENGLVVEV